MKENEISIKAIVAMNENRVIGCDNAIPWHFPEDLKRFSALTKGHTVLMGRRTYQSLPPRYRPLPERKNVVVSTNPARLESEEGIDVCSSLSSFVESCKKGEVLLPSDTLWIIGGGQVYTETLQYWDELYLTLVHGQHQGDAYFPSFEDVFELVEREDHSKYSFLRYVRKVWAMSSC